MASNVHSADNIYLSTTPSAVDRKNYKKKLPRATYILFCILIFRSFSSKVYLQTKTENYKFFQCKEGEGPYVCNTDKIK